MINENGLLDMKIIMINFMILMCDIEANNPDIYVCQIICCGEQIVICYSHSKKSLIKSIYAVQGTTSAAERPAHDAQ